MRAFLSITAGVVCFSAFAAREVVQIADDGVTTIPPNSIATPGQVSNVTVTAEDAYTVATNFSSRAEACVEKLRAYSTNSIVTSTVYVQSIGGVPYDPSNQTIIVRSFFASPTEIEIIGTVRQFPLVTPTLDFRVSLAGGAWSNIAATVVSVDVPDGATDAVAAYKFTLPRPDSGSAFFRIVDNSTGASGSGLWWIVFGGIAVDGKMGANCIVTNGTDELRFVGGILVEPEPLGGL